MPNQTYSYEPIGKPTKRSRWMRLGAFALVLLAGSLLLWNDARTADTNRPNKGLNTISDNMVELAEYVPGEVLVKFRDGASNATVAAAHTAAGGETIHDYILDTR
jgi:hypothetical protein